MEPMIEEPMLEWFEAGHLPAGEILEASAQFAELASMIVATTMRCPERTVALRKLLEAKDAAVRATIWSLPRPSDGTS
jgi:hypothetical protein